LRPIPRLAASPTIISMLTSPRQNTISPVENAPEASFTHTPMQANRKQETIIQKAGMAVVALQRRGLH